MSSVIIAIIVCNSLYLSTIKLQQFSLITKFSSTYNSSNSRYYKTPRGYHARSGNSNDGWRVIGTQAYANARFLYYINEIRSAVLVMHGEKAHSRYFGEAAYKYMVEGKAEGYNTVGKPNPVPANKRLLIVPGASHCDLYDGVKATTSLGMNLEHFSERT